MQGTENMTMEELLQLREEMGSKQFEEEVSVPKIRQMKRKANPDYQPREKSVKIQKSTKLVKHAPEEIRPVLDHFLVSWPLKVTFSKESVFIFISGMVIDSPDLIFEL